jgi:hypothetical protein
MHVKSGGGGYYASDYFYVNWSLDIPSIAEKHINVKETVSIILALQRWTPLLRNKRVIVHTDNTTAKAYINKGSCRDTFVMDWLRRLFLDSSCF